MYSLAADVSSVDTDYGLVLLDQASGDYYSLNPSGALVLRALLRSGSVATAVSELTAEFAVVPAEAEQDVQVVITELVGAKLLIAAADPAERGGAG